MNGKNKKPPAHSETETGSADAATANGQTESVGFLLMPGFSMLSFAAVLEPLRMANRLRQTDLYQWHLFSPDHGPVRPSNGIEFAPTRRLDDNLDIDTLLVVAGIRPMEHCSKAVLAWLRAMANRGVRIGATSTGPLILASAGLLTGYKSTVHWENLDGFREQYPRIHVTAELFEVDRDRFTCSGGTAGLDLMMHLIGLRCGLKLANAVAEQCIHPKIRPAHDLQRMALPLRFNVNHPRLLAAIAQMETHLEDPLPCSIIAELVGLSQRQVERLFEEQLGSTPARFYKRMRLERATALLEQTSMSVLEIAVACGYASSAHLSTSYRQAYGHSPRAVREARRSA